MTNANRARILLVIACMGWGVGFPLMKAVMDAQRALTGADGVWITSQIQLVRYVAAGVILSLLAWWTTRRRPTTGEWTQGAVCGVAAAIGMQLQVDALNHAPASTVGFITQFYVLVIPLVTAIRLRRWPGAVTLISVILALGGVAVLSGISFTDLRPGVGEMMVLAASIIFTVQILALEAPRWSGNHGLQVCSTMFIIMTLLTLPFVAFSGPGLAAIGPCLSAPGVAPLLVLIILASTCLPYAIMNSWQREVTSTEAGIIYCSEALFAAGSSLFLPSLIAPLLGITYINESPSLGMAIGGGLIIGGAILVQLAPRWRSAQPTSPSHG